MLLLQLTVSVVIICMQCTYAPLNEASLFVLCPRWYYTPGMSTEEAYVFKTFDSLDKPGVATFSLHSAFYDPEAPAEAEPRQSIELRAVTVW